MDASPRPRRLETMRFRALPDLARRRVPVVLMAVVAVALVTAFGLLTLRMTTRRTHELDRARARLSAQAQVRQERMGALLRTSRSDAAMVARFPSVLELLGVADPHAVESSSDRSDLVAHTLSVLDLVVDTHDLLSIVVAGPDGAIVARTGGVPGVSDDVLAAQFRGLLAGGPDVHDVATAGGGQRVVFLATSHRPAEAVDERGPAVGAVALVLDPSQVLGPVFRAMGSGSATGEVVLATRWEQGLRPHTSLRFPPGPGDPPPLLKVPVPEAPVLSGEMFVQGPDYRDREVLAVVRDVPGSPWRVAAKMDLDEALEGIRLEWAWILSTTLATLLAVALSLVALTRHYRSRHYQDIAAQEARYRALAENARDIILVFDAEGRIVEANRAAVVAYGRPARELVGMPLASLRVPGTAGPSVRERLDEALSGEIFYETEHRRRDGTSFPVEVSARGIRQGKQPLVVAIIRDMTERRRMERQSLMAQRMEALGQLAGGVAHDFNNLLTAIRGYAVLVQEALPRDDAHRDDLEEVVRAADRAADLTRQLLAFSRRQATERRVVDLNAVVRGLEGMLPRLIREDIVLRTDLWPHPLWVRADGSQLENLLVNLVVNARDAMPQGGTLTLSTSGSTGTLGTGDAPRDLASLEVADTGIGMSDEVKARAFEPFFTTKEQGRGTGLGLSTCYGIVQQHEGSIHLESALGRGTRVRVDLPLAIRTMTDEMPALAPSGPPPRGTESILLAEDDDGVRSFTASVLRALGYTVTETAGGLEAADLVASQPDLAIDLLVTDVVMPGISGVDLRNRLRELRPGLRALFVSGYAESSLFEMGGVEKGAPVLRKPYSPSELGRKVRDVLDRKPRPAG